MIDVEEIKMKNKKYMTPELTFSHIVAGDVITASVEIFVDAQDIGLFSNPLNIG